ncbi:MarR family winged helix-turn-helix transcriptional regulator [Sphaerotilus sp.]|uniref:MarR family winged helix-turn-helix transcriptional regulator n=1 Tax=Sphaerotilus sp. TaxID=2093942 RepID=UPI002ACE7E01|nr:MarR family transcriptional regulator [Sphaerotilus sp.]MDZ7856932.1 MarR family transcriptional regulator [Sphaerotilus sp.]
MPSPSLELCLRLTRAYAVLTRRLDNKLSSVHGLSFSDFMVLHSLARAEGQRLRRIDLAERMGLTASGVTRTLLPLEKIGLVGREADPRDARVGFATLTPAGQELHGYALTSAEAICREATQAVSDEQLASVLELLGQMAGINLSNA